MKEVFRNADSGLVSLYQSILDDAEIVSFVQNTGTQQSLVGGLLVAIFPIPLFYPTLYVLRDEDYAEAMTLLSSMKEAPADAVDAAHWTCSGCGEEVPGNFTDCWRCLSSRQ